VYSVALKSPAIAAANMGQCMDESCVFRLRLCTVDILKRPFGEASFIIFSEVGGFPYIVWLCGELRGRVLIYFGRNDLFS
jgi:hypothetical protein